MGDTHKPRHIRDIAHLYISGSQHKPRPLFVTLLISGEDKRCFSGFHAANLAAALSAKGCSVHLFERSGLLPNAGFFMSLPPRQYIRWGADDRGPVSGIGGVTVDCSPGEFRMSPDVSGRPGVEIVHLPPLFPEAPFRDGLRDARDRAKPFTIFLILGIDLELAGIPDCVATELNPAMTCIVRLSDTGDRRPDDDASVLDLGQVAGWETALADRVPVVIRAPDSVVSRAYHSISESLLFRINQFGRKSVGTTALGISPGIRPRSADRRREGEGTVLQIRRRNLRYPR